MTSATDTDTAKDEAIAQVASICALVAALGCDFDKLAELREEREGLAESVSDCEEATASGACHSVDIEDARRELAAWDEENGEELAELTEAAGEWTGRDAVEDAIREDPLSLEVRSGWADAGDELTPEEFRIVLCTGGPHVEILGEIDNNGDPARVRVIYKDWGTSGELFDFDHDAVRCYCQYFSFTV